MRNGDEFRFNGSHKACGGNFSVLAAFQFQAGRIRSDGIGFISGSSFWKASDGREFECARNGGHALEYACPCGKTVYAKPVIGKYRADKKCDGRCLAATGHSCECACGGKNHGANH